MTKISLQPHDGRKSFYGKCEAIKEDCGLKLRSYNTVVAEYHYDTKEVKIHGWYSMTTARHINSFLSHFGLPTMTKKEMQKEPTIIVK